MPRPVKLAMLTTREKNQLPDSAFLIVLPGGEKDEDGRTVPRSLRVFPFKTPTGAIDLPRLRNALARIPQATRVTREQKTKLAEKARGILAKEKEKQGLSMKDGFVVIASEQDGFRAASGHVPGEDGVPRQRFTKDIIRVGNFIHPKTGQRIDVDAVRLEHWSNQFHGMKASGVDVTVPDGHDGENLGLVLDTWVAGDRLIGLFEMVGEDAIVKAERNKVSPFIVPEFTNGEGKKFEDAILHVALTSVPVITKQKMFAPIAASRGSNKKTQIPIYLSEEPKMDKIKALLIERLKLKLDDNANDDTILAAVTAGLDSLAEAALSTDGDGDDGAAEKVKVLQTENAELKRQAAADKPATLSRDFVAMATGSIGDKLSRLVEQGRITPDVSKKLQPLLAAGSYMLSLDAADEGKTQCRAMEILDALLENDPVKLSEQTGTQTIALDRDTPGGDAQPDLDPDLSARAADAYGVPADAAAN